MKVLLLCTHLNPGGLSRYVLNLSFGLKRAGHEVVVASSGGIWEDALRERGIESFRIPLKTKSVVSLQVALSWQRLRKMVRDRRIELVHAQTRVSQAVAWLLHTTNNIPWVSTFHGFYRPHFFRRAFRGEGTYAIAISRAVQEHLVHDLGFDAQRVAVVYNGIDATPFLPAAVTAGLPHERIRLGILSRLSAEKAIDTVIGLLPAVKEVFPSIQLLIAGAGKQEAYLRRLVKEHALGQTVSFLGTIDPAGFFRSIEVLLFPSRKEGLGFTVLEAKAAGKIVVASTAGGIKELIRDGYDGFLLESFTAENLVQIIKRLRDGTFFQTISARARVSVGPFSIETMTAATVAVYEKTLSATRQG